MTSSPPEVSEPKWLHPAPQPELERRARRWRRSLNAVGCLLVAGAAVSTGLLHWGTDNRPDYGFLKGMRFVAKEDLGPILGVDLFVDEDDAIPERLLETIRSGLGQGWEQHGRLFFTESSGLVFVSRNGKGSRIEVIPQQSKVVFGMRRLYAGLTGLTKTAPKAYVYEPPRKGTADGRFSDIELLAVAELANVMLSDAFGRLPNKARRRLVSDWLSENSQQWASLSEAQRLKIADSVLIESEGPGQERGIFLY